MKANATGGDEARALSPQIRTGSAEEIATAVAIDEAACALYHAAQIHVDLPPGHPFSAAERLRWLQSANAGGLFFAFLESHRKPIGLLVLNHVDGEPYLDQLAVHPDAMRRGVGRALVRHAQQLSADRPLWLTTYAHLPWNRPFYAQEGFVSVSEAECGPEIRAHLAEQRRVLPLPEARVAMRWVKP